MRIFLIGFMGSGKTTLGEQLSKKLDYVFVDLDKHLEQLVGMTVAEIFSQSGEDYFRVIESEALVGLSSHKNIIVAAGGGAPCFFNNIALMNQNGKTIYLKWNADKLYERLKKETSNRPLLKGMSDNELIEFINKKLLEREKYYEQALHIVEESEMSVHGLMNCLELK